MAHTQQQLAIGGDRKSGDQVRRENVLAAVSVSNVVKSSLGPIGLDKMLVDEVGDVTVTNDGATILKLIEVEHPAAKVLVELADLQDQEVGDGTTSVVIIASELLKVAQELVRDKIHPTSIINGFRLASQTAVKYIKEHMMIPIDSLGTETIINAAKTSMASKIIGPDCDFFAKMVVDAMMAVKRINSDNKAKYPVKAVNILKVHGGSAKESKLIDGYAINATVASQAMVKRIEDAKIACLDFNLMKTKMKMGVQVLVEDPAQLEKIRKRELDITKERIQKIMASGANVIITTAGIDDAYMKYFVEAGAMAVRRCRKEDIKRIARSTGATLVMTMANFDGDEVFEQTSLGSAAEVYVDRICDDECVVISKPKAKTAATIILRGANDFMLDEMDRSVHDSLCVVKRVLESKKVVPGGGAVEAALSVYLDKFATSMASREQLAISKYAEALLIIPRTLSVNAAKDACDLVAKLRAFHHAAQTDPSKEQMKWIGLDLVKGVPRDNTKAGVLEPGISKIKSIKFATEAAITILRIDDHIKMVQESNEDPNSYHAAKARGELGDEHSFQ